jgi:dynactin complex subunit
MTTADRLGDVSMTLRINKKFDKNDQLAVLTSLIEMAERLDKLEAMCPGRKSSHASSSSPTLPAKGGQRRPLLGS